MVSAEIHQHVISHLPAAHLYTINEVDDQTVQVVYEGTEFCVATEFDDEQECHHYRAQRVCDALNLLGYADVAKNAVDSATGILNGHFSHPPYLLASPDASTTQVITDENTEWCTVSSFVGEKATPWERASRILVALDMFEREMSRLYDEWAATFKPCNNHIRHLESIMFETFGEEWAFVKQQPPENVWTIVDTDGDLWLCPGFHSVNRFGYAICEVPFDFDRQPDPVPY